MQHTLFFRDPVGLGGQALKEVSQVSSNFGSLLLDKHRTVLVFRMKLAIFQPEI